MLDLLAVLKTDAQVYADLLGTRGYKTLGGLLLMHM